MIEGRAILATIKKRMKKYEAMGLINDEDVFDYMLKALKPFGQNIMELQDKVIQIENGRGVAPAGIHSIKAAFVCEPEGYVIHNTGHKDNLQESVFWKEIVTKGTRWNSCDECNQESYQQTIVESIYFDDTKVDFYYKNPIPLVPSKSMKKDDCAAGFRRILGYDYFNEINLRDRTVEVNFRSGDVYLKFYGVPLDDEGIPFVPISQHEKLETYILYYIQRRLMEQWWINGDLTGIENRIRYLLDMERDTKELALTETKFSTLSPRSLRKIKYMNRLETLKFECMFPSLDEVYNQHFIAR